ncbi:hypothetical protein SY27_01435 [Flavobacterium sp. 316]|uniref:toxin-antitoxin system YwqK family antitoxin n=1 Tax=Flavobacterium sp. 316 TaxID=1603293 RepID=UPI0005DBE9FA|nr:hypothetical protein [Flavobacterium sp. 316]KIX22529.1 hypothetical protein SY27_01435 [Flavobacterium sp. 316]
MLIKKIISSFILLMCCFTTFSQEEINKFDDKGDRHGLWKGNHEKSKRPRYEGSFNHGKEIGVFNYFDDTKEGTIIATRDFSKGDGSCYVIFYNQKKDKVSEGKLVNKVPEGEWKYYHFESKQLMTIENYKSGKLNGKKKIFYKDGSLAEESNYLDGKLEGTYKKYAENETILEEINYKKGQLNGVAIYYDGEGKISLKGQYKNDKKWGYWETYENGKLSKKEKISKDTRKTFKLKSGDDGKLYPSDLKVKNESEKK